MSGFEISLFLILTSIAGMFVGGTVEFYTVDGLPVKNQTKPLCTNECPAEDDMPPLLVVHHFHNWSNPFQVYNYTKPPCPDFWGQEPCEFFARANNCTCDSY